MMKHATCNLMLLIFGLSGSGLCTAGALSADEVRQVFTGKSVQGERQEYTTVGYRQTLNNFKEKIISRFAQDGTLEEQFRGQHKTGKWRVDDDGGLCVQMAGRAEHCDPVMKRGNDYVWVMRNKAGKEIAQIRYTDFTPDTAK